MQERRLVGNQDVGFVYWVLSGNGREGSLLRKDQPMETDSGRDMYEEKT